MLRIAVLGSTRGTDLQALLDARAAQTLGDADIVLVISNNPAAEILSKAQLVGVETHAINTKGISREDFEEQILALLKRREVNLILLIGFMRILSGQFIKSFGHPILNIHPSLLPKYAGGMNMDVHAEVLKNREVVTGCTLHYVTDQVDTGPIYGQQEVAVLPEDTPEILKRRVQAAEQLLLVKAIRELATKQ